jgi:SAM-dependent methyltransferase
MKIHLDLGCGPNPKNTYDSDELWGIDIRGGGARSSKILVANLAIDSIPFPDNYFDGVSAYDFFEHIPRVSIDYGSRCSRFPFVELMNEIWRVLKPSGRLYAMTPAFPSEKVFRDPTHVNIISSKTHRYFTAPHLLARMYGFNGNFELIRQSWVHPRSVYEPPKPSVKNRIRNLGEKLTGQQSHLIWEFLAVKTAST